MPHTVKSVRIESDGHGMSTRVFCGCCGETLVGVKSVAIGIQAGKQATATLEVVGPRLEGVFPVDRVQAELDPDRDEVLNHPFSAITIGVCLAILASLVVMFATDGAQLAACIEAAALALLVASTRATWRCRVEV